MEKAKYRVYTQNQWVFPDDKIDLFVEDQPVNVHIARGGNVAVQFLTDINVKKGDKVTSKICDANGIHVQFYQMVPVTIPLNSAPDGKPNTTTNPDEVEDFVTRKAPFDVYDALAPMVDTISYDSRLAFTVRMTACSKMAPGAQMIDVTIETGNSVFKIQFNVIVHKAVIPHMSQSKLSVVNWVVPGAICAQCNDEIYSDAYWKMYRKLLTHLVDIRNNHLSIAQTWRHEPDEAVRDENGKIIDFDLSYLEKALKIAEKAGMTKLYGSYVAHWVNWNEEQIYLLWDWDKKCDVSSCEAYRQLKIYFTRVREMVERNGWHDKYIQPLVDEPQFQNAAEYRILCGVVRSLYPELVIHDPVEVYNIAGAADIISVKQAIYEKYLDEFKELQASGQRMTYYACGAPAGRTMNRVLDLPVFVGRLSFWMCHRYNFEGYLHWGYHNEGGFDNTNFIKIMSPGNHSIVYCVDGEYWETIRSMAQLSGAEDWELLSIISEKEPETAHRLVEKGCRTFDDYEMDPDKFEKIYLEILETADRLTD
ncbi:MAG: DUF4091 domain-containing protein [Clostridia bacterium]|nr:DUF4091 domain-containing protein [Clostridia bacterium]